MRGFRKVLSSPHKKCRSHSRVFSHFLYKCMRIRNQNRKVFEMWNKWFKQCRLFCHTGKVSLDATHSPHKNIPFGYLVCLHVRCRHKNVHLSIKGSHGVWSLIFYANVLAHIPCKGPSSSLRLMMQRIEVRLF